MCGSTPPTRVTSKILHTAHLFWDGFRRLWVYPPVTLESTSRTETIERTSEEDEEEEGRTRQTFTLLRNLRPPRGGRQDLSSTATMAATTTEAGEGATGSRELALEAPEAVGARESSEDLRGPWPFGRGVHTPRGGGLVPSY